MSCSSSTLMPCCTMSAMRLRSLSVMTGMICGAKNACTNSGKPVKLWGESWQSITLASRIARMQPSAHVCERSGGTVLGLSAGSSWR